MISGPPPSPLSGPGSPGPVWVRWRERVLGSEAWLGAVALLAGFAMIILIGGCGGSNSEAAEGLIDRAGTEFVDQPSVEGKVVGKDGRPPATTLPGTDDADADGPSVAVAESAPASDVDSPEAVTVAVALSPGLTPQDAILEAVTGPAVEIVGGDSCRSLTRDDQVVRCGEAAMLVWEIVSPVDGRGTTVTIYRVGTDSGTPTLTPVLQAVDERDRLWDSVGVKAVDLSGDKVPEVVLGFRTTGSGNFLEVDVVANDGQVVLHRSLYHGEALYYLGVYADYAAKLRDDEPNCCPSTFVQETLSYAGGRWSISKSVEVSRDEVLDGLF